MKMEGSCHCGAVSFSAVSHTPYPFMHCYCSICRKTSGCGGFGINLKADYHTLMIQGESHLGRYHPWMDDNKSERSPGERRFCRECGTALWVWDPRWPEMFHPHASCIDTPLPKATEKTHIFIEYAPDWVDIPEASERDHLFYIVGQPRDKVLKSLETIEDWHKNRNLLVD